MLSKPVTCSFINSIDETLKENKIKEENKRILEDPASQENEIETYVYMKIQNYETAKKVDDLQRKIQLLYRSHKDYAGKHQDYKEV